MATITRRDFLRYCGFSAVAMALTSDKLGFLSTVLANPAAPSVIWLHGSSCTGCSPQVTEVANPGNGRN